MLFNKKSIITLMLFLVVAGVAMIYLGVFPSTSPIRDDGGIVIPDSITILEAVELNGMEQWISIRGYDRSNPILLWLHGGPGSAQMPLSHYLDGELEKHYVVVHWDQRGAGKSNHRGFSEEMMTVEQYKEDALALIAYLTNFLGQDKIYLLGHSWGTQLGIELVAENPDLFHAYISVSQVVDHARAINIATRWLRREMEKSGDAEGLIKLNSIENPVLNHGDYREFANLAIDYGGNYDRSIMELALIAFRAPEYTFIDYYRLLDGMERGGAPLHKEGIMAQFNYIEQVPEVGVPVYFLIGEHDYNTPMKLVEEYFKALEAPHKELFVFEESAHTPFLSEPEEFTEVLIKIKEEVLLLTPRLFNSSAIYPETVQVNAGIFQMGDEIGDLWDGCRPVHAVELTYDFLIGKYEVTFDQFDYYCDLTGRPYVFDHGWERADHPVIYVTWWDAIGYCNWLSRLKGLQPAYNGEGKLLDYNGEITTDITRVEGYRLPTEAEWEYAASGGHEALPIPPRFLFSGSDELDEVGWYFDNSGDEWVFTGSSYGIDYSRHGATQYEGKSTQPVGQKQPNQLGIYDMSGNVWEWCHDYYASYSAESTTNPIGAATGHVRVMRGGSWVFGANDCRVGSRLYRPAHENLYRLGFRVARTLL